MAGTGGYLGMEHCWRLIIGPLEAMRHSLAKENGNDLFLSAGVAIDTDIWTINGDLNVNGYGDKVSLQQQCWSRFVATTVSANSITIKGAGGSSTDTANSKDNYGVGFIFSDFEASTGDFSVEGAGGAGGNDNSGLLINAGIFKAPNGKIDLDGFGGSGQKVEWNTGVSIYSVTADELYLSSYTDPNDEDRLGLYHTNYYSVMTIYCMAINLKPLL